MNTPIKVGINGFGRIGRKVVRLAMNNDNIEIVGINDLGNLQTMAHLLKYDSVHGTMKEDVRVDGNTMIVGNHKIRFFSEKDPAKLPWNELNARIVHECTGIFTAKEGASLHIKGGAKKVIISAPSKDPDITICMGVNDSTYNPSSHNVISNASCTTNCLAPLVKVLDENYGVVRGIMTTIHAYTNDQNLLDLPHKDLRRARAGALSMIPTTTGAAKAVGLVLPHLKGKIDGFALRVPTPNVSMVDFVCELKKSTTKQEINDALKKASTNSLKGILGVSEDPLVSIDFNGNTLSSIADLSLTTVIEGNLVKAISWYDNESGYSARMLDLTMMLSHKGL